MNDELVSFHESAHATVAYALGGAITGPLSIEPTRSWRGVAFVNGSTCDPADLRAVRWQLPAVAWPAVVRSAFESEILVCLAGAAGEQLASVGARVGDRDYVAIPPIERLDEETFALSAKDAKLLASGDDPDGSPAETDFASACALAEALTGDAQRGVALLRYLQLEVEALLRLPGVRARVERLARELLNRRTLGADTVRAVLD